MFARNTLTRWSLALTMACALTIAGRAWAADAVTEIDDELTRTAAELSGELDQATKQIHEAERLGTPSSTPNVYGSAGEIDSQIAGTVDVANEELRRAKLRDDYTEKRRELETTRSLYYPGTKEYVDLTNQIQALDDAFTASVEAGKPR